MTNVRSRLASSLLSQSKWSGSRIVVLAVALFILALGVLAVLIVQPAPRTFADGWSAPQTIEQVRLGQLHRAVMDSQDNIHLVWLKQVDRKLVAFYTQLDRNGHVVSSPRALSELDANAEDAALVLTRDGEPTVFWIEKGEDEPQRLMMARPGSGDPPEAISSSPKVMRDLAVTSDEDGNITLVWSDNREGSYDLYMTVFDSQGNLNIDQRRITDSGQAFVYDPVLAAGGGRVHVIYFSDEVVREYLMHKMLTPAGETLTEPQVLEQMEQMAMQLGGETAQLDFQMTAVAEADGALRLYESLGPLVQLRKIDSAGHLAAPPEPLLVGSGYYSRVDTVRGEDHDWLVWADTRRRDQDRFQVYAAPLDEMGGIGEESRLTYALSSALWPVMMVDRAGGRHVIWQQSSSPYTYELMYINDLHPARISVWQRLGFTGEGGPSSFLVALAQSAIFAVITLVVNTWRLAVAWGLTAVAYLILRRFEAVKPYLLAITWAVLLLTLFLVTRPETRTLGQMPIDVATASHWVMGAAASALVLFLGWVWREEFHGVLIWAGIAGLWLLVYYYLNLTLVFREGFAV